MSSHVDAATPRSGAAANAEQPPAHLVVRGDGDPVLLLHGWATSSELFLPVLGALEPGRRLIVPDLPGFGATPEPPQPWGVGEYVTWTLALLDRLGVPSCDIIGHSNGARIALTLAARHPRRVRRLVLTGAAGLRHRQSLRARVRVRTYKVLRRAERSRALPAALRASARARAERRGSDDYRAASGVMRGTLVRLVNDDVRPLLAQVRAPTLLVWGADDDATPLADGREMEHAIPDAGLVVFEHAGHYAYLEQAQRFATIVDVFLRGAT